MSSNTAVQVPEFGHGLTEALIVQWCISVGDHIERGDVVAVLETDKTSLDLLAEKAGTVTKIARDAQSIVVSGEVLYTIDSYE